MDKEAWAKSMELKVEEQAKEIERLAEKVERLAVATQAVQEKEKMEKRMEEYCKDHNISKKRICLKEVDLQEVLEESLYRQFGKMAVGLVKKCWKKIKAPVEWFTSLF